MRIFSACTMMPVCLLPMIGLSEEPILDEPLNSLTAKGNRVQLVGPSALGEGRDKKAVLLEARTENLLLDPALTDESSGDWILLEGAQIQVGELLLPQGAIARQIVQGLQAEGLYCLSVRARAVKGKSARISLAWEGADVDNVEEFDLTPEGTKVWVSGKSVSGSATVMIKSVDGVVKVDQPQFEKGGTVPTSFVAKGQRAVSGLVWSPQEGEFNPTQGTVSFWINPLWAGAQMSSAKTLFYARREGDADWAKMSNVVVLNAWLTDPNARDWRYALNVRITDRDLVSHMLSVPLHDLTKEWHHIVLAWNLSDAGNGRIALYIDGEVKASSNHIKSKGLEDVKMVAFGQGGGGYLDGWLDDAQVYASELSEDAIKKLGNGK